jgi:hypothetical protein
MQIALKEKGTLIARPGCHAVLHIHVIGQYVVPLPVVEEKGTKTTGLA